MLIVYHIKLKIKFPFFFITNSLLSFFVSLKVLNWISELIMNFTYIFHENGFAIKYIIRT